MLTQFSRTELLFGKEAMDKLDRMAQSLGELIDREDTLLRNILESDRKRK